MSRSMLSSAVLSIGAVLTLTTSSALLMTPTPPQSAAEHLAARTALAIARKEITVAPSIDPQLILPMRSWNAPDHSNVTAQAAGTIRAGAVVLRRYRIVACLNTTCASAIAITPGPRS